MYQPVVAVDTSKITGFEALVRWPHPERGLVPPNDFIVAEETGLVVALDRWVLKAVYSAHTLERVATRLRSLDDERQPLESAVLS